MNEQQQQSTARPFESSESQNLSLFKSQNQDTIRWMLDFKEELEDLKIDLSGITIIDGKPVSNPENRRMNNNGIYYLLGKLRMALGKITALSNMTDEEIYADAKDWSQYLIYELYYNTEAWGIKGYAERSAIAYDVSSLYLKLLLRAKGALQLKSLNDSIQRQEKVFYGGNQPNQSPKFWEFWKSK